MLLCWQRRRRRKRAISELERRKAQLEAIRAALQGSPGTGADDELELLREALVVAKEEHIRLDEAAAVVLAERGKTDIALTEGGGGIRLQPPGLRTAGHRATAASDNDDNDEDEYAGEGSTTMRLQPPALKPPKSASGHIEMPPALETALAEELKVSMARSHATSHHPRP